MTKEQFKKINRILFVLGTIFFVFQSCKSDLSGENKPNIIIIVADDQGWGDLGVNGNSIVKTPNIDKLANGGVQFSRFYVSPVCSPTRAEMLTGRYHPRGGVYSTSQGGERLDLDERTIAQTFKSKNYKTAAYGKWHNGSQPPYHPNNRGFDEFYGFCSGHWGNYFSPMLERNGEVVGDRFIIDDLTNNAIEYIEDKKDDPFFVYLAYNTPHSPMQVPDKWWDKYKDVSPDPRRYDTIEKIDKTRAALSLCENIDWNVGQLVDKLDRLKLLENTILIYMSDNGPNGWRWNDGLKGIKGHTDEGGVRSPFIVYWKDKLKPQKINQVAGAIDILPTLADLAEIDVSADKPLDGVSLKPLLLDQECLWNDRIIFSHWNGNVSLRNRQYMLDKDNQVYDLIKDPGQQYPIEHPSDSLLAELMNSKREWINSVLIELNRNRKEVFPVGFEGSKITQLPARDGIPHGTIKRSSRWPNASYFTNWTSESDSISWNCDILASGRYKATAYYTCAESAVGSVLSVNQGNNEASATILEFHDPPFNGVEFDRFPREESFEKDFKPIEIGVLNLDEGLHAISLKASSINGPQFIDFRLLVLESLN